MRVGDGGDVKEFKIDQVVACSNSNFFRAAMAHDFKEAETRVVTLSSEDPVIFKVWLNWILARTILCPMLPTDANDNDDLDFDHLVKAYALGEKLDDVGFKDAVIDAIAAMSSDNNEYPVCDTTGLVWRTTLPGSPLRRLVLDRHVLLARDDWFSGHGQPFEYDFLFDLARAFTKHHWSSIKPDHDVCHYHSHEKAGLPCYRQIYRMAAGQGKA